MAKKLNSFLLFKFESSRLKEEDYTVTISVSDARRRGELIRFGDSQLLHILRNITGRQFDPLALDALERQEKRLKSGSNSEENKEVILGVRKQIDDILFVPEIVSVKIINKKHYEDIVASGLVINGRTFVRLMSGAGNLRRDTVILVDDRYYDEIRKIMDNGRDTTKELNPGKFVAYEGLYNSSGHRVSFPNFCVVPDYIYTRHAEINWISNDDTIDVRNMELGLNCFDGQGLISVNQAERWAIELDLDYIPSTFIVRAPFAKGQLVTFDFQEYCRIHKKNIVIDIWGNPVDIRFVDLILTESQFKLASSYQSLSEYIKNCYSNDLGFYISRVSPKEPKNYVWSNYMFLQVLDLSDDDIREICKDTIEYFGSLLGGSWKDMVLYLGGDTFSEAFKSDWFDRTDNVTKAIIINNELANDPYIVEHYSNSLSRKMKDASLGKLLFRGNFSQLVADPFMQCQGLFEKEPISLLSEDSAYYKFWSDLGEKSVASCRSPLTHQSEMTVLSIENTGEQRLWYRYQGTSFIYNPKSLITLYMADSDVDGDLNSSFCSPHIKAGKRGGLPISYEKVAAKKEVIKPESLWRTDGDGFHSKVGFYTNLSSTSHTILSKYSEGTDEYLELQRRLMLFRRAQGEAIDTAKNGGRAWPVPLSWYKWNPIMEDDGQEDIDTKELYNSILADKRPAFMRYLYSHYGKSFNQEEKTFDTISKSRFGMSFSDLLSLENKSDAQIEFINYCYRRSSFIRDIGVMNKISNHMTNEVSLLKSDARKSSAEYDYRILLSADFSGVDSDKLDKLTRLYRYYRRQRKIVLRKGQDTHFQNLVQLGRNIKETAIREISSNIEELCDLAVIISYGLMGSHARSFVWNIFGDDLVEILLEKSGKDSFVIPVRSPSGTHNYLFSKYEFREEKI